MDVCQKCYLYPFIIFSFSSLRYTDRLNTGDTGALWIPFQTAAGTVTTLYKGIVSIQTFFFLLRQLIIKLTC